MFISHKIDTNYATFGQKCDDSPEHQVLASAQSLFPSPACVTGNGGVRSFGEKPKESESSRQTGQGKGRAGERKRIPVKAFVK
jgi:hypothetical protein